MGCISRTQTPYKPHRIYNKQYNFFLFLSYVNSPIDSSFKFQISMKRLKWLWKYIFQLYIIRDHNYQIQFSIIPRKWLFFSVEVLPLLQRIQSVYSKSCWQKCMFRKKKLWGVSAEPKLRAHIVLRSKSTSSFRMLWFYFSFIYITVMGPLPTHWWTLPNPILIESQVLSSVSRREIG